MINNGKKLKKLSKQDIENVSGGNVAYNKKLKKWAVFKIIQEDDGPEMKKMEEYGTKEEALAANKYHEGVDFGTFWDKDYKFFDDGNWQDIDNSRGR